MKLCLPLIALISGFYNGILAAGLIWGLVSNEENPRLKTFFLAAIAIAGSIGATTVSTAIYFVQMLPGLLGMFMVAYGWFFLK
jgi:putative membrane protein